MQYVSNVVIHTYRQAGTYLCAHKKLAVDVLFIGSLLTLAGATIYISFLFTLAHLSTGDQYDNTYLTLQWHPGVTLTFLAQHTNLVKLPFLWLQATLIPYNTASLAAGNIALVGTTTLGSVFLVHKLYGRRLVTAAAAILVAALLLASPDFSSNLVESSIRNIEYLIAFIYIYLLRRLLAMYSWKIWVAAMAILALLVASDLFFLYVLPLSIIIAVLVLFRQKTLSRRQAVVLATNACAGGMAGLILLKLLSLLHVLHLVSVVRYFLPYSLLGGQIGNAIQQAFVIMGGEFFGQTLDRQGAARLILTLPLVIACAAVYIILAQPVKEQRRRERAKQQFLPAVFAVMFLATFGVYVLSGFATATQENIRYITIVPFLAVLLVVHMLRQRQYLLIALALLVFGAAIICLPAAQGRAAYDKSFSNAWIALDQKIITAMSARHVSVGYGTLGYSATTWFLSHRAINVYNIRPCNSKNPVLSSSIWYVPKGDIPTALVIDRSVAAAWEWETWANCSDDHLVQIYGQPEERITVGYQQGQPIEVWFFNYDIAKRLVGGP